VRPLAVESQIIANRYEWLWLVSNALDFLFYAVLKEMEVIHAKPMEYYIAVTFFRR
jgi:hypothetical protein